MSDDIEVLSGCDFEAAMDFLDRVFGEYEPHDFRSLLPSAYQPSDESMRCNLAIRRQRRLLALVGVFPVDWRVGDTVLRVGRIGGVAVAPDYRGQGLMRRLMHAACQRMWDEGCALGLLDGDRKLYQQFGFERAGTEVIWHVGARALRHEVPEVGAPSFSLGRWEPDQAEELAALSALEPLGCRRTAPSFGAHLVAWHHEPRVARDASGRLIGYVTGNPAQRLVTEIVAPDPWTALAMAASWSGGTDFRLLTSALPSPLMEALNWVCDRVEIRESGNWRIHDWPRVLGALLGVRHRAQPLPWGRVVIGLAEESSTFELVVDESGARCLRTEAQPQASAPASCWMRALTGPLPSSAIIGPGSPPSLAEWLPLPLWLSRQDHV